MSVLVIPTSATLTDYSERIELDGAIYTFRFRWNVRLASWFVDIFDANDVALVYGRRCVVNSRLTGQQKYKAGMMPGELTAFDTTNRRVDPALLDFGTRVLLFYFDAAEVFA